MDNYKTISTKLETLTPFRGNSLMAYWENGIYYVYSYSTIIAIHDNSPKVHDTKYSQTTSRHQNLVRKAWAVK